MVRNEWGCCWWRRLVFNGACVWGGCSSESIPINTKNNSFTHALSDSSSFHWPHPHFADRFDAIIHTVIMVIDPSNPPSSYYMGIGLMMAHSSIYADLFLSCLTSKASSKSDGTLHPENCPIWYLRTNSMSHLYCSVQHHINLQSSVTEKVNSLVPARILICQIRIFSHASLSEWINPVYFLSPCQISIDLA